MDMHTRMYIHIYIYTYILSCMIYTQTEKNCKKLREMLDALTDDMQELEEAVNLKNPALFEEVSVEDTEVYIYIYIGV